MSDWIRHFLTVHPIDGLPLLKVASRETRRLHSYRHLGLHRQRERHVVFQYTLEGEGCFEFDGKPHRVPPGFGFLTCVHDPLIAYYLPGDSDCWQFLYCCASGDTIESAVADFTRRHGHIFPLPLDHAVINWLRGCERLAESTRIQPMHGAQLMFDLLAALEVGSGRVAEPSRRHLIKQATAIIHADPSTGLFVGDLAERLNVTREHLTRVFGDEIGLSPHAYITRERMLAACRLLRDSSLTVKEVAARCGYSTTPQFTRAFKRVTRQTPSSFRESGATPIF